MRTEADAPRRATVHDAGRAEPIKSRLKTNNKTNFKTATFGDIIVNALANFFRA